MRAKLLEFKEITLPNGEKKQAIPVTLGCKYLNANKPTYFKAIARENIQCWEIPLDARTVYILKEDLDALVTARPISYEEIIED
jgi:hypothetical protein